LARIRPTHARSRPVGRVQNANSGAAMNRSINPSRITDEMYARIPALLEQGTTTTDIAAMYGVTLGTLKVFCSQRGISLRKGGARPPRAKLVLLDEPLPLSNDVLKSLRGRALNGQVQHGEIGKRLAGEDRERRSLQGRAGRACPVMR
jgi:hypothetical protein